MKALVIAKYGWRRMTRSHYNKGLIAWCLVVFGLTFSGRTNEMSEANLMGLLSFGMRLARGGALFTAVWIGSSLLSGELSELYARTLLTKPVRRIEAVLGLTLAGMAYVSVTLILPTLLAYGAMIPRGLIGPPAILVYQLTTLPAIFGLLVLSQFLSMLTAKPLTIFFSVLLAFEESWDQIAQGLFTEDIPTIVKWPLTALARGVYYLTPFYERFAIDYTEFARVAFPFGRYAFQVVACGAYIVLFASATAFLLSRREI